MLFDGDFLALVTGGADFGESDRVVQLLTEQGPLSAVAYAARRSKRRLTGATESFATIRAQLSTSKKGRVGMPTLEQASVESARLGIRSSLENIALATYVCELASRGTPEGEAAQEIFLMTSRVLDQLQTEAASVVLRRTFELQLLAELGYLPELGGCLDCGQSTEVMSLDLIHGGLRCAEHSRGRKIGPRTRAWMQAVLSHSPPEAADAERAAKALRGVINDFYRHLLEGPVKSARMLEELGL